MKIKNRKELLSKGDVESRKVVLNILEGILRELDSHDRLLEMMQREGSVLRIGEKKIDLAAYRHVYAFTAGKASNHMAKAFEYLLGEYLTKGICIVKVLEDSDVYNYTEVYIGGHPLPAEGGIEGCRRMIELAETLEENDLLFLGLSGGATALMSYPIEGITLEDLRQATDIMLKSGMWVMDINDVRGHLCRMNRGKFGTYIKAGDIVCLEIWDAVGIDEHNDYTKPVPIIGTPVGHDWVTFEDVHSILLKHNLFEQMPQNIQNLILEADSKLETPKKSRHVDYYIINTIPDSLHIGKRIAEEMGLDAQILTTYTEGESREFGTFLATIAKEIQKTSHPFASPVVILSAGETTTFIPDSSVISGHGGPSHEMSTSFALLASSTPGACLASIDSEGTDGTSMNAGGLTDSTSLKRAQEQGVDLKEALRTHATFEALSKIGDSIYTGNTGTNLCDINILYIP